MFFIEVLLPNYTPGHRFDQPWRLLAISVLPLDVKHLTGAPRVSRLINNKQLYSHRHIFIQIKGLIKQEITIYK